MDPLGEALAPDVGTFWQKCMQKELGPVGGRALGTPPRSANALVVALLLNVTARGSVAVY